ncbi:MULTISPECIES: ABC transporter transmembrane domain-containing protein [unclassified Rhodococcus (in: high G+C Gram-positive bacteria)]|uniref:ABC transporter transmembrane domain-containing protein n=1 Tax=unclassified Rhodococcus (in: high G+C Gram-positive bacteria) TaxID=192944 RepID=UPI0015C5A9D2|nr:MULTISPECIES: ABC transporter ATP-binding protein [unclassified Rhodococcus (in: high G+C Gram-positive bacteria)]
MSTDLSRSKMQRGAGPFQYLLWLVKQQRALLGCSIFMGTLWMVPVALLPFAVGQAIDQGVVHGSITSLWLWSLVILGLVLLQAATGALLNRAAELSGLHAHVSSQRDVVMQVTELGCGLSTVRRTGDTVAVGTNDVERLDDGFEVVGRAIGSALGVVLVVVLTFAISPMLALIVLFGTPLAVLGLGALLRPLRDRNEIQRDQIGTVTARAVDIGFGLRVLTGIGGQDRFVERFLKASADVRRAGEAAGRSAGVLAAAGVLLPGLVVIVVTWAGARLALSGEVAAGQVVALYGASGFLVLALTNLTEASSVLTETWVAAGRVSQFVRLTSPLVPAANSRPLPNSQLSLYDGTTQISVASGALTVIGGSTVESRALGARLARHVDSDDGLDVLADGVSLRCADLDEVRTRILLCSHTDVLFSGTLSEELLSVRSSIAGPKLEDALLAANAMDIIDALPEGLDNTVSEGGKFFSGGQRQRLILARAIYADPEVLILDAPTSAVDSQTEARIVDALYELRRGRTTIVMSNSSLWRNRADHVYEVPAGSASRARPGNGVPR